MSITNDKELEEAAEKAGHLLQQIQDYCEREYKEAAKVRFPRGFLRTAAKQRGRLIFIEDSNLKSNLAYCLILSDTLHWILNRTDIAAIAKDMLIKLHIFIGGALIESITKDYLKNVRTPKRTFKFRTKSLEDLGIIDQKLREDLNWIWDTRNKMHLFGLTDREYTNDYDTSSQIRTAKGFKKLVKKLKERGRIN